MSVFGASMCTYDGYSNNIETNSTIGNNAQFYGNSESANVSNKTLNVEDTFWMQLINQFDMNLLVNNSWSGSKILDANPSAAGYNTRPTQLHADTGANAGISPDVIVSFMGNNDFTSGTTAGTITEDLFAIIESYVDNETAYVPQNIAEGYIMMIYKMVKTYPNAKIFIFNMAMRTETASTLLLQYNEIINKVTAHYGCYVVDLTNSIMSGSDYLQYSIGDNLHPNAEGMDIWTNLVVDAFKRCYLSNN